MAGSCDSCEEYVCESCEPSFSTSCDGCEKTLCRLCTPSCEEKDCEKDICHSCRGKRLACRKCRKLHCDDHRSVCSGCKKVYCTSCVKESQSDEAVGDLGSYCKLCTPNSFTCADCHEEKKYGACSVCESPFECIKEACTIGGRNHRWCTVCEVSYCSECSYLHQEECKSPEGMQAEVVWFDHFNEQFDRRMKRFKKAWWSYGSYEDARMLHATYTTAKLQTMSIAEKMIVAKKVYKIVEAKHGSVAILDIGHHAIQPRINQKFKKKNRSNSTSL
mmetsp:Transcript_2559/g.5906  ORF Transcript_2559/g.5906 Transcript_2559/m.5906 type:complete len:275 (+) Transcript_2559:467-1291(+)